MKMKKIEAMVRGCVPASKNFAAKVNSVRSAVTTAKMNLEAEIENMEAANEAIILSLAESKNKGDDLTDWLSKQDQIEAAKGDVKRLEALIVSFDEEIEVTEN